MKKLNVLRGAAFVPGFAPGAYREASSETAKEMRRLEEQAPTVPTTSPDPIALTNQVDPNSTLRALENVVMDRDGSMVSTNYTIWEFFNDLLEPPVAAMMSLQNDYGIPMWLVLAGSSLIVRLLVVPLTIKGMRAGAMVAKGAPKMQALQERLREAKTKGNPVATARLQEEWIAYHKNSEASILTPFKYMIPQALVFMYMYLAIRRVSYK